MLETLIVIQITVSLAGLGALLYISNKIAIVNDVSHLMLDSIRDLRNQK